jgi:predicted secreted Zn-dependent protease
MIRTASILFGVTMGFGGAMPTAAYADPITSEAFNYYDVDGATARDIRADLNRRGPMDRYEHRHFDAVTRWTIRATHTDCGIKSVSVRLQITYAFPRLTDGGSAPSALRKDFDDYLKRLLTHEKGHAQIAIDTAKRVEDRIQSLPAALTCEALDPALKDIVDALIAESKRLDVEYDARTEHGRKQGAVFPMPNEK